MDDILLDRVRNRLVSYVDGGSRDHSIVLSADADRDARSLWDQAHVAAADGECSWAVLEALGWLHWIRYEAQPSGKDRDDLQAATVFFSKVHRVTPNRTPPQLRDFWSRAIPQSWRIPSERKLNRNHHT